MKNTGSCPKCHSSDVLRVPVEPPGLTEGSPLGVLTSLLLTRFVCGRCGYAEEWVESADDLEGLKKRYGTARRHPPKG